jgi:hypothetical protein
MITHKEFYFWLEGYLTGKLEDKNIDILTIAKKMNEVKDVDPFFPNPRTTVPSPLNPIIMPLKNNDDPHKPPFDITC